MITIKDDNVTGSIPLSECSYFTKWALATDSHSSPELLKVLLEDEDERILYHVLSNPNVPIEIMEKYIEENREYTGDGNIYEYMNNYYLNKKHKDAIEQVYPTTIMVIADNPSCPEYLLKEIAKKCDNATADALFCYRNKVPDEILEILRKRFPDDVSLLNSINNEL